MLGEFSDKSNLICEVAHETQAGKEYDERINHADKLPDRDYKPEK
jgi:hypothetical protein